MGRWLLFLVLLFAVATPLRSQEGWAEVAPMPTPRAFAAVAVLDGKVYVMGGRGPGGAVLGTVERYDPATDRWQRVASLRRPRYNASATVLGNGILLTGGNSAEYGVTEDVEVYVPGEDEWESFEDLEGAREGHTAFSIGDDAYVIGGANRSGALLVDCEVYDGTAAAWVGFAPWALDLARAAFASVPQGGGVLLFGGFGVSGPLGHVEFYEVGQPEEERAELPEARGSIAGAGDDGRAWAIGGRNGLDIVTARVDVYVAAADRWDPAPPLPAPREGAVAAYVDGALYVFGGQDGHVLLTAGLSLVVGTADEPGAPGAEPLALEAAGRNPFRDGTHLALRLDRPTSVTIAVYDAVGRRVAVLHDGALTAGHHVFGWDGADGAGRRLPPGLYVVRAVAREQHDALRLTLVR